MKHGKREMPREHRSHKGLLALVALVLILCCTIGGTVAWLATSTDPVTNTFTPAKVKTEIDEDVTTEQGVKKDVKVKNNGDIPVYVRAAIIVNWVKGENEIYPEAPEAVSDYKIDLNTGSKNNQWTKVGNYYYYNSTVPAKGSTENLINTCNPVVDGAPDGYTLRVTILAEAIQANPERAVADAWEMKFSNNSWESVRN